jgi:predicted nucleic acid-binding protein
MNKVPAPKILVNTSSWINIFEVGLHAYLIENFDINTTPKVVEEIKEGEGFARDAEIFKNYIDKERIQIIQKSKVPDEIMHEISISSGEIELASTALNNRDFIILIDDSKVYRVLERIGIKYISSVNIVIDASITGHINKKQAFEMLEKLRISFSDEAINKAKDVIINGNKNQSSG